MLSESLYDRFGDVYNVTRVLNPNGGFNQTLYDSYSPLFMPLSFSMTYLATFALSSCALVHTMLYHGNTIFAGIRSKNIEKDDIHAKLMRAYPEVPDWWYVVLFVAMFVFGIVTIEVWHTEMPVWAFVLALVSRPARRRRRMMC